MYQAHQCIDNYLGYNNSNNNSPHSHDKNVYLLNEQVTQQIISRGLEHIPYEYFSPLCSTKWSQIELKRVEFIHLHSLHVASQFWSYKISGRVHKNLKHCLVLLNQFSYQAELSFAQIILLLILLPSGTKWETRFCNVFHCVLQHISIFFI